MTETIGRNPEKEKQIKIESVAKKLSGANFLKPTEKEKDELGNKLKEVFKSEFNHGPESFKEMGETVAAFEAHYESASEANAKNIKEDMGVLKEAVLLAARELSAKDSSLEVEFFLGSKHIENMLPEELKGLGKNISKHYIANEEIDRHLNLLEITRENTKFDNPDSVETLSQKINVRIEKLKNEDYEEEVDIKEQDAVLTILNGERKKCEGFLGLGKEGTEVVLKRNPKYERRPNLPKPGEEGVAGVEDFTYDMKKERFIEMESKNKAIRWYDERPPQWYERMSPQEQEIIDIRVKWLNACSNKEYLRNRDVEKLRGNVPEITGREMKLLWEKMPGFKEALGFIVRDLCEEYSDADGRRLLRLKTQVKLPFKGRRTENKNDFALEEKTKEKLELFGNYREKIAADLKKRKIEGVKDGGDIEAVSTAWNFLYLGDSIEAWDYFRELKPTLIISDKLRTVYHPMIKALGKWGVWKGSGEPLGAEGKEEPFVSGALSSWILDRLKVEKDSFKERLIGGDLKDLLPRTLGVSAIETIKVGKVVGSNMALTLMDEKSVEEKFSKYFEENNDDKNIMQSHNDMLQGGDYILNLIRGKIPYVAGKNELQFVSDFIENTSLIRQQDSIPFEPDTSGKRVPLASVDKPEFFAWALTIALGFDSYQKTPLPDAGALGGDYEVYDLKMQSLVAQITQRSSVNKKEVLRILAADSFMKTKKRRYENWKERMKRKSIFN